jgi:hypothetical protein
VSFGLRELVSGLRGYTPFTYRGLVQFLIDVEGVIDHLGEESMSRQEAAHQLIYDVLVEPAEHVVMPNELMERNMYEVRQMRDLTREQPLAEQCRRVGRFWYKWVEARGLDYPRGIESTWLRIWEMVTLIPRIEEADPEYLAYLLAPPPPTPPPSGSIPAPQPLATFSSESSNSVTGPAREENADE